MKNSRLMPVLGLSGMVLMSATWAEDAGVKTSMTRAQMEQEMADLQAVIQDAGHDISDLVKLESWMDKQTSGQMPQAPRWSGAGLGLIVSYAPPPETAGIRIAEITQGGPAAQVGLQKDDLITAIDGSSFEADPLMSSAEKFKAYMDHVRPNEKLNLTYLHAGKLSTIVIYAIPITRAQIQRELDVVSEQMNIEGRRISELAALESNIGDLGVSLGIVPADAYANPIDAYGLRIAGVTPGGIAARAGLKPGDVITAINGTSLRPDSSASSITKLLQFMRGIHPGALLKVDYLRDGNARSATLSSAVAHDTG